MKTLHELMHTLPQQGQLVWIGVRPDKDQPMIVAEQVEARIGSGLTGDRFKAKRTQRELTFIQAEHIDAVASMLGKASLDPALLRRNLVVRGINLLALKGREFSVGQVRCRYTGLAHPCSKMERLLGPGGYNAMRGHGGITATIVEGGILHQGDIVSVQP